MGPLLASILHGLASLTLQVEVGPADPALLIGEYVCGAKLEAEDHVEDYESKKQSLRPPSSHIS